MTLFPTIHLPTTWWFYDSLIRPGSGEVIYGELDWPSYATWMVF